VIALPWSVVTALKLQPVGMVDPMVLGLRWMEGNVGTVVMDNRDWVASYEVADRPRLRQVRDILGSLMYDPRGRMDKHPWYAVLCELQREVTGE